MENGCSIPFRKGRRYNAIHSLFIHSRILERETKSVFKKKKHHHHGGFGRRRRERRGRSGRGVEVRFISNPLLFFCVWLHFLNIIFPFFPSLFHLGDDLFFKIPIIRKWETRFLSLFSPSGGGRDIVVESSFPDHRNHRSFYRSPFSDNITQSPSGRPTDQRKDDDQREHQIRLEDDVVSFSSRDKTHETLWTDRFATPKKFKEQQQQQRNKNKWRRRRRRRRGRK